jgi:hypothetical protein
MEISFSCIKKSITARCLMRFDTVENEPPIMTQTQCKPLCVPSCTTLQKIETMNNLGLPLQGHTTYTRYLHGGITFWMSHIYSKIKVHKD